MDPAEAGDLRCGCRVYRFTILCKVSGSGFKVPGVLEFGTVVTLTVHKGLVWTRLPALTSLLGVRTTVA